MLLFCGILCGDSPNLCVDKKSRSSELRYSRNTSRLPFVHSSNSSTTAIIINNNDNNNGYF